jgi:hypothetical protein
MKTHLLFLLLITCLLVIGNVQCKPNYREALAKSLLFFQGQRSGRLPPDQQIKWRSNSGLSDGRLANVCNIFHFHFPFFFFMFFVGNVISYAYFCVLRLFVCCPVIRRLWVQIRETRSLFAIARVIYTLLKQHLVGTSCTWMVFLFLFCLCLELCIWWNIF